MEKITTVAIDLFAKHGLAGLVIFGLFALVAWNQHQFRKDRKEERQDFKDMLEKVADKASDSQRESAKKISESVDRSAAVVASLRDIIITQGK